MSSASMPLPPSSSGQPVSGKSAKTVQTSDGLAIACHRWPTPRRPRATIALVHGLAEHAGRYDALAARLNAAAIEVVAVDLRGHGRSPGARTWVERFDEYLLDTQALLEAASDPRQPEYFAGQDAHTDTRRTIPLFLMGHSMGGAISALFAIERAHKLSSRLKPLDGLILSSPALAPGRNVPRWMISASRFVSRLLPRFPAMKVKPDLLARDPAVVDANRQDPLVHHAGVPARTGAEILDAMERIERGRTALRLPILVFHGSDDKLTEPKGSRDFAAHTGSPDCTLTIYEGSYHETMNDFGRERVIDALIQWIEARSPA